VLGQVQARGKLPAAESLKDGRACVQAGGGWVNDSEPEAEFQETVNKSKAMLKAVALAELFGRDL
jgi:anthranilate synthase component 1